MFGTESQIDANFYELIHQLATSERTEGRKNRRSNERQPFWTDQRIAPVRGEEFPDDSAFVRVRCYDLTRAGFSFFLPDRPAFTQLVAAFGDPPEVIYVRAEVVRFEHVLVHSTGTIERPKGRTRRPDGASTAGHPAVPMVLVGCRFTARVEKPPE